VLRRIIWLLLAFPAAIVLVTLAVSNRHPVELVLDPLNQRPVVALQLPLYVYLFSALIMGVVLGGVSTWISQSSWRRTARSRTLEAMRWQAEADRLSRERDRHVAASRQLLPVTR
jgi:uncharacterized integral membrane protein